MLSLEPSKDQITTIPCGLETTCDSGILDDCSGQNNFKTYGTAGYCVQPSEYKNVACMDDCNCLGTHCVLIYGMVGSIMACRNDYKHGMNGKKYVNTRFVKYYTDTCESNDMCGVG